MSAAGFNGNEALRSRVLMDITLKPSVSDFERLFCACTPVLCKRNGHKKIEALRSRVLMDVKALGQKFRKVVLRLYRKQFYKKGRYITMTI